MSEYSKSIDIYGKGVNDFEVSPFESIEMLHRRSRLEHVIHELSKEDRIKLLSNDLILIKNAQRMSEHIGKVYNFSLTDEPLNEWWWHLEKVANGKIAFNLNAEIESDMVI